MKAEHNELYGLMKENYEGHLDMLKYRSLTESDKVAISKGLIDQIYVTIAERYNSINFEMIPKSTGVLNRMKEFANLQQSITLLANIAKESKQQIPEVSILQNAMANIIKFQDKFHQGFVRNNAPTIMTYNVLAMSLYCGTSLMISVLVDYINANQMEGAGNNVDMIIDNKYKRTQNYLMIDALAKFNDSVNKGTFSSSLELYNRDSIRTAMTESVVVAGAVIAGIVAILKVIPLLKELIYVFYYTRVKLSDALSIQADLVTGNLETLKNQGVGNDSKVYRIQKWFADKLSSLSSKFALEYERGEKQAQAESRQRLTSDDIHLF